MHSDIKKVLITNEQIEIRSKELAIQINEDYKGETPIMLCLLKGSVPFMATLIKYIDLQMQTEFMIVSSYHGGIKSSGEVRIIKDIDVSVSGRKVIIVEDIVDSGITLHTVIDMLKSRGADVEVVCLLDKPYHRTLVVPVKYVGFEVPDEFVVGFGLDYKELYRNLPFIGVLKEEVYTRKD